MRVKLTAKHPRPAAPDRAPVRAGSPSGRKPVRAAAPAKPAGAVPSGGRQDRSPAKAPGAAPKPKPGSSARPDRAPARKAPRATDSARQPAKAKPAGSNVTPGARRSDTEAGNGARKTGSPVKRSGDGFAARSAHTERRDRDERRPQAVKRVSGEQATRSRQPERREGEARKPQPAKRSIGERAARATHAERGERGEREQRQPQPATRASGERAARATHAERGERGEREQRRPQPVKRLSGERAARRSTHAESPEREQRDGDTSGTLRLSKRMSELGLCSRREADEWIENGWVNVDGVRVDTLGARVRPDQRIEVSADARAVQARQVTVLLHKPVGYVSGQAEDGYEPAVTLVTAANRWDGDRSPLRFSASHLRGLAPAGRLDIDSTGLLVLTQDGRIAKLLIGEHSSVEKEYLVRVAYGERATDVAQHFPADKLALLRYGLSLDGSQLKPAKVSWQNGEQLRFVLREGKKRQIRRMCELVGLQVVGLKRVRMGSVTLGALPPGKWRYLLPNEAF
ncbi:pseudouridine synthase [Trinickia sp. EG282A]|uniref:pseudouridine synthase n=1 Tax=Trinickia sp. EG282A TaxID=3237013 RepID=UPI0034D19037